MSDTALVEVELDRIVVPTGRRRLSGTTVDLAESIAELGHLINPITVTKELRLVAGLRRLEAVRELGWKTVPCMVLDLDDLHAGLAEVDENIIRNEPTELERGDLLKRRKEIYEALHPETKAGGDRGNQHTGGKGRQTATRGRLPESFTADTSQKTGISERSIRRGVQVATDLTEEAKAEISETPVADSQRQLLELAKQEPATQKKVAGKIKSGKARTVKQAMSQVKAEDGPSAAPMDDVGVPLPDRQDLRDAFAKRPVFSDLMNRLSRIKTEVAGLGPSGMFLRIQQFEADISNARRSLRFAKPLAVCPYCAGAGRKGGAECQACRGSGWVPESVYEGAPAQMKADMKKEVA